MQSSASAWARTITRYEIQGIIFNRVTCNLRRKTLTHHIGKELLPVELGWTPPQEAIVGIDLGDLKEVMIRLISVDVPSMFTP